MNRSYLAAQSADLLAYIPSPPQGVWQVGPFALRAYALFIILGIIIAIAWGDRRWQARGGEPGTVLDIALWAIPFGFVGGRAYHVATDWQKYFGEGANPVDALKVWQGGLGIWGAVALGAVGAWIGCRAKGVPLPAFGDAVAPGILLAQAIGRLGNYFNQELYGQSTDVAWGLAIYTRLDGEGRIDNLNGVSTGQIVDIVHPTFLYELLWNVFFVVVLVVLDRKFRLGHGRLFALYVAGYSFGRFFVELLRADPANEIFGIRINSFTSAIVFTGAVIFVLLAKKGREEPEELVPAAHRSPTAAVVTSPANGDSGASENASAPGDDTGETEPR
ncbi:prolipoprotein diacylglyceryl transferase [Hoyosella rhizosphaerae]|uniref:Phosphatidylglycerol--prolipoprotein diacylglyceryl transferase n=1 Tax=Hoyosella rhizosphaerae TaxID=1755582 RepID=A0A916XGW6_9ACTN|nr:prolipoprotein diacylglyceryl transferase [Hoyosella rhizosphaerae]MBN4925565.1 prolipoprotein diacylglyceryl transferase [Hoyosella rhizosphaerae]GGC69652.1 hypothetical protein GCM10011410_23100 [Hoyosella rhizosphaerae]